MKTVICSGSFDPVTNGHLDIIQRASRLFDRVIVLVAVNQDKQSCFTAQQRREMLQKVTADLERVEVQFFDGLLVDYIQENQIYAIVRGLRAVSDFEYELQMAMTNHELYSPCETVFFTPSPSNMYVSSSIVRQVGRLGGDISRFVPSCVLEEIMIELKQNK